MTTIPRSSCYTPSKWGAAFHARREEEVFGAGSAGPGKALALDTIVPTTKGLRKLEDVHPGDEVISLTGVPAKVVAESPVWVDRPCFELTVAHQRIIADAEHEWVVNHPDGPTLRTTRALYESAYTSTIPFPGPADFGPPKPFKLDPYVLGVVILIGQPSDRSRVHGWDIELYSILSKIGYNLKEVSYRVSQFTDRRDIINELVPATNRRIPPDYLLGSFNQRMALLEGIVDGNGGSIPGVAPRHLPFLTDLFNLCASLGLNPRYNQDAPRGTVNRHSFTIQGNTYRCSRRSRRIPNRRHTYGACRWRVNNLKPHPSVPVKCIQVEGGTYCITPLYVPTHNSMVLLADPLEQVWTEHMRCQQESVPKDFPADIKALIEKHPLRWGYSEGWALHLRRTMTRLGETIQRAHRMFPLIDPDVDWNEKRSTFTFSSGFRYQFGHCKDRHDHNNYLGQQYSHVAFDELIEFNKDQYDLICSRTRTGDPVLGKMLKRRSASNPKLSRVKGEDIQLDDPQWVRRYFVDPAPEGKKILRTKIILRSGEVVYTHRLFLPATLYDNPDPDFVRRYEIELRSRPKHIQEAYLYGRWDSVVGSFFEDAWNPDIHRCRPFKIPQHWPIFRSLDWGFVSHGNLGYYALDPALDTLYKFWECSFQKKKVTDFVKGIMRPFEEANKLWSPFSGSLLYGPADTQIWEERGESALSKYHEFVQNGVDWCYADKRSREDNAQRVYERLMGHENLSRPPKLIFFENCKQTLQVLPAMQTDPNKPTEPAKGGFDHAYDETSYACAYIHGRIIDPPNYKGKLVEVDDDEERDVTRGSFGYWQG